MVLALTMALLPLAVLAQSGPAVAGEVAEELASGIAPQSEQTQAVMPILFRSLLAGLSTSLGAAVVLLLRTKPSPAQMSFALSLAGGVMVTVSFIELWLPQLAHPEQAWFMAASASLGGLIFAVLSKLLPEPDYTGPSKAKTSTTLAVTWKPAATQPPLKERASGGLPCS